jgi:hypothetical protein
MPNIDFDQKPRGATDRVEYRQAAGAGAEVSLLVPYLNERGRFLLGRAG